MDILTFSQVLFNTLASLLILLLGVVLFLVIYYLAKITRWVGGIKNNVRNFKTKSSQVVEKIIKLLLR